MLSKTPKEFFLCSCSFRCFYISCIFFTINMINYNTFAVPGKPAGPLRCTNLTHNSVTLTWNPPDDDGGSPLIRYEVECLYSYSKGLLELKSVNKDTTSYTFRELCEGNRYTFRVHACNKKGRSEKLETDEDVEPGRVKGNIYALTWEN